MARTSPVSENLCILAVDIVRLPPTRPLRTSVDRIIVVSLIESVVDCRALSLLYFLGGTCDRPKVGPFNQTEWNGNLSGLGRVTPFDLTHYLNARSTMTDIKQTTNTRPYE